MIVRLYQSFRRGSTKAPAIGAHHQRGVGSINQRHARREQRRENQDIDNRSAARGFGCRYAEQADLGRGVETQSKQEAERIHVPGFCDQAEQRSEQPREQAATGEQRVEALGVVNALLPYSAKRPPQAGEDDEIDGRDHEQEQRRHRRADKAADLPEQAVAAQAHHAERKQHGRGHDDRGMAERKIEPDTARCTARLHQLAHDVVDGGDVVGIDGVAQAEHPGQQRSRQHRRPVSEQREGPGPCGDVGGDEPPEQHRCSGFDRPQRPPHRLLHPPDAAV